MKNNLFFVSTVYQLFAAIAIRISVCSEESATLVLSSDTPLFAKLYEQHSCTSTFDKVIYFENRCLPSNKIRTAVDYAYNSFNNKRIVKKYFGNEQFSDIYFFNPHFLFQACFMSFNGQARFHSIDDGMICYLRSTIPVGKKHPYRSLVSFLSNTPQLKDLSYDCYLFNPNFYIGADNHTLVCIPCVNKENRLLHSAICSCFLHLPKDIEERYIFFEEAEDLCLDPKTTRFLVSQIAQIVGYDNFVLKRHPRNKGRYQDTNIRIMDTSAPWEVICLTTDMSSRCMLSFSSTASLSSKVIMGGNEKVILLYELLDRKYKVYYESGFSKYIQALASNCHNIHIPKSFSELKTLL